MLQINYSGFPDPPAAAVGGAAGAVLLSGCGPPVSATANECAELSCGLFMRFSPVFYTVHLHSSPLDTVGFSNRYSARRGRRLHVRVTAQGAYCSIALAKAAASATRGSEAAAVGPRFAFGSMNVRMCGMYGYGCADVCSGCSVCCA